MGGIAGRAAMVVLAAALGLPGADGWSGGVSAQAFSCADLGVYEVAQTLFDADPAAWAALDPDGDGTACPELPHGAAPALWTDAVPAGAEPATVLRAIDGDTVEVEVGGAVERVRLILVDTPETRDPNRPVECFGAEAAEFTTWLTGLGAPAWLETDVSERDRYGRLLRYLWLDFGDGTVVQVNEAIARSGYGVVATFPPDVRDLDRIRDAEAFARRHGLGLWNACGGADALLAPAADPGVAAGPAAAPGPALGIAGGSGGSGACDPSYPDACIPPAPPDLDCGDVAGRRFTVLPPDPHRFDGDGDGVGCER